VRWKKITLVGIGLLGGSLGQAVKKRQLAENVVGYVRRAASVKECEKFRAVDMATRDLQDAVKGAELIVLCTPIAQMRELVGQMLPAIDAGAVITDVGSVKRVVVEELEPLATRAKAHFVGSHPMAGSEKTGVSAARADLFVNAVCVVTPTTRSRPDAVRQVEQLWKSVGGQLLRMTPATHDEIVSRSSHLPHVVAAGLANLVLGPRHPKDQASLCANGFRDTTRIASSSPEMWRDIALANRENLSLSLTDFQGDLREFQRALRKRDARAVLRFFETAKTRRDFWSARAASSSQE